MHIESWKILRPIVSRVIARRRDHWELLREQIEAGIEFSDFPYYPAATEFIEPIHNALETLENNETNILIAHQRFGSSKTHEQILKYYSSELLEKLLNRAKGTVFRGGNFW